MGLLTVSSTPCSQHAMPHTQEFRLQSASGYDVISPDFPPPSRKPNESVKADRIKKKDKKWSIGGFFRRKKRVSDTDSSSPVEEDEDKKGFLERRKAERKRKNRGSKDVTSSFDHVRITHPSQNLGMFSSDQRELRETRSDSLTGRCHDSLLRKHQEVLVGGSSGSLENTGRKGGRIQVKARVEASRERLKAESSSDEGESSKNSLVSLSKMKSDDGSGSKDGSISRRSRAARTERYKKRLSRDEESLKDFHIGPSSRISRSDERLSSQNKVLDKAPINRWTAKVVYYESSDYETKYTAKTKSATPSPLQSPKPRPKNALHCTASAPPSTNYVTYPPSHAREGVASSHQELRSNYYQAEGGQKDHRPNQRNAEMTPPGLPKSNSEMINKTTANLNQSPIWKQDLLNKKSTSYDCHVNSLHYNGQISHPHPTDENILIVQFPISQPGKNLNSKTNVMGSSHCKKSKKPQNPPPPPPRDPNRRVLLANGYPDTIKRPMSYAFEDNSPQHANHVAFSEFGSKVSAFQRVPKNCALSNQLVPALNINNRSNSDQHIQTQHKEMSLSPHMPRRPASAQQEGSRRKFNYGVENTTSNSPLDFSQIPHYYHYYTDQQPRSRKPIHVAYHEQKPPSDQYISDPQVVIKPPVQQSPRGRPSGVQTATEFWKQKDQETAKKIHISDGSPKLIQRHLFSDNILKGNPASKNTYPENLKTKLAPLVISSRGQETSGSASSQSRTQEVPSPSTFSGLNRVHNEIGIPVFNNSNVDATRREFRPMSLLEEQTETSEQERSPGKERHASFVDKSLKEDFKVNQFCNLERQSTNVNILKETRRSSGNLEEALNELEAIYKSLRSGDENHAEKIEMEQRHYENIRLDPTNWNAWVQSRGFESDSSFNYSRSSLESVDSVDSPVKKRSKAKKSSIVPDRLTDDMAFRKLNQKVEPPTQEQEVISQVGSFLLVSPTLSPPPLRDTFAESIPSTPTKNEPDVTLDDVVYRNVKHANNTLKVLDPQPPFGIPLGPVTPAPNSDYLHVKPKEIYRPTFKPRKTPDVVTDDLAFRNLRKDNNKEPLFNPEETHIADLPALKKKRAVRSLSANLLSIMQKEPMTFKNSNNLIYNNNIVHNDLEKSQSFTDLINNLNVKGNCSKEYFTHNRQLNELKTKKNCYGYDSDDTPRTSRQFSTGYSSPSATSTETLTDKKASQVNKGSKINGFKIPQSSSPRLSLTPERRHTTDSINPFKRNLDSPVKHVPIKLEPLKVSFIAKLEPKVPDSQDYTVTESHDLNHSHEQQDNALNTAKNTLGPDVLTEMAREAKETSDQLSKELNNLELHESANQFSPKHNKTPIEDKSYQDIGYKEPNSLKIDCSSTSFSKLPTIGRIIHHKPVKLNTFKVTENNQLENKQTEVTHEPIGMQCSSSMTDLLNELTRSLDLDFDTSKESEDQNSSNKEENEDDENRKGPVLLISEETDGIDDTTEPELFSEAIDPCERKESEENYFSSLEEIPDRKLSSPELSLLQTLSELAPEVQGETVEVVKNSFPLVIPDENLNERPSTSEPQTSRQHWDLSMDSAPVSRRGESSISSRLMFSRDSGESTSPGCSRDPDCSVDCANMTDEGTKCVGHVLDCSTMLLACMACAHQLAGLDFLTVLGLVLAMASLILFLVL